MYRIRKILKKGNLGKDGKAPLYVEYAFNRHDKVLFKTGKRVAPVDWNPNKREVRKSNTAHIEINNAINSTYRRIETIADRAILRSEIPTTNYVQQKFIRQNLGWGVNEQSVSSAIENWLKALEAVASPNTFKGYNTFKNHLFSYLKKRKKKLTILDFNATFYDDFLLYLETEVEIGNGEFGLLESAAGKNIKNLKVFLKWCFKEGLIQEFDISGFKVKAGTTDHVYVTEQELDKIQKTEFHDRPHLVKTRDLFVVGCETGLRYSDLSTLRIEHVQDGFIRKPIQKSTKKVIVPVSERLKGVLERYPDGLPRAVHNAVFNRQIKEICRAAGIDTPFSRIIKRGNTKSEITIPKYEAIASHTCRRSFCTNQFLKGMPTLLIRKISGHKTERAFLQYIRIDEEQAAEEMAKRWVELRLKTV